MALGASIEDEERRTSNHNPAHYAYPISARTWSQRREPCLNSGLGNCGSGGGRLHHAARGLNCSASVVASVLG